jgi:hypothetical protein
MVGAWHHYCFTVRFARFYDGDMQEPSVSIAQAFFFVDGQAVREQTATFLSIDIKTKLSLTSGLTAVYVGGPNPSVLAPDYVPLCGSIDNVRIWWPSCPHHTDKSRCNPFAFLYPKLQSGDRTPSSGIQDADVQMSHVAQPVLDAMFNNTVADANYTVSDAYMWHRLCAFCTFRGALHGCCSW